MNNVPSSPVEDVNLQLLEAVALSDEKKTLELLAAGADPNAKGAKRQTALKIAVQSPRASMVKLLLESGAHLDQGDLGPLNKVLASENPSLEIISMLIEAAVCAGGCSSALDILLYEAKWEGSKWWNSTRVTVARLLLNTGAKPRSAYRQYLLRGLRDGFFS